MKVFYKKHRIFKLFGLKIFDFTTDYIERSSENDDLDNGFYIELQERIINLENKD